MSFKFLQLSRLCSERYTFIADKITSLGYLSINGYFRAITMTNVTDNDGDWRGVPMSEIVGSQSPWGAPEFPLVVPGHNHTVLYHVPSTGCVADDRPPVPQRGEDRWDSDFVRMPCSSKSLYPVEDSSGEIHLKKRWKLIENALREPMRNSEELAAAILSYNTQFKSVWKFRALHNLFNEHLEEEESQYFFDVTLPEIAKLALALPKLVQCPIPLLKQHKNHSISLSQQQISSLLANAFFCTFPRRNSTKRTSEYASFPHINFNNLYEATGSDSVLEKLKCLCHYFKRVCSKAPCGAATFSRRSVPPRRLPRWPAAAARAAAPLHARALGTIEGAAGLIQLDFANKYLGGGVLGHGCVQEEIRFAVCPELMAAMLFTEVLRPNEAVMMIGCEQYSRYTGYASTFQWAGALHDAAPRDAARRRRVAVLALDALPCRGAAQQYRPPLVLRELNKAWVGFSFYAEEEPTRSQYPGVATGNWGCGAFGGSPDLKALLQLMAAAAARRPLAYYTFGDAALRERLAAAHGLLARHHVTVGQLYNIIIRFGQTDVREMHLHAFIEKVLKEDNSPKSSEKTEELENSRQLEKMDISNTSNDNIDLPEPLQKELKESPDIFAQDETDSQGVIVISSETDDSSKTTVPNKMAVDKMAADDEMAAVDKMAADANMAATSVLFHEMNKFDRSNGRLNLSVSNSSILNEVKPEVENASELEKRTDPASEVKRRKIMKITDYFSKNTI